ncbi:hypothetical protein V5799_013867, partial [Amblyomma americanum]
MALRALILALAVACGVRADDFPFMDCTAMFTGADMTKAKDPKADEGLDAVAADGGSIK